MEKINYEFFDLIADSSKEATNEQIQNAYEMLIGHIDAVSQAENDLKSIIRKLNSTRIDLVFLETQFRYEQGKKHPKICLSTKSTIPS